MRDDPKGKQKKTVAKSEARRRVNLKELAAHLGLNPATVSVVLNNVPGRSIPQATRERIKAAAKQLNYEPNLLARSFRSQRTHTIGILVPELGDGYHNEVMSGIGDQLINAGYFYFTAHHRHRQDLIEDYTRMLVGRGAQGIIAIDTAIKHATSVPVVAVAGHRPIDGVTNVVLNHRRAAELALTHLYSLGHRQIAFMHGQLFSSDSDVRWKSLVEVAAKMDLEIKPEMVVRLDRDTSSPELGYPVVQQLQATRQPFTALVAFNDISAIGAIRALQDIKMRVPGDVSVIGFDDIKAAAFVMPRLTTIHQPLGEIGRIATQALLDRLHSAESSRSEIIVEPTLVVRESTGPVKKSSAMEPSTTKASRSDRSRESYTS
ncbi:LacI family DNA-binding transcriptional regulator [Acidicapsa dinghuensis]|uniref:LacI family DNA-binding transcriptional regulator n=1 Tax=Acidicapsa dinghuensis TaxID=2218256 RepID=A0ABW1EFV8_9BACT|nr:LacI family DNA-binding transcriptional regulator [Acidicapsa dinghuensis]